MKNIHSKIFPLLFKRLNSNQRLTVFDAGAATPETVAFFSQYKCRLHFSDLYSEPLIRDLQNTLDEQAMQRQLQTLLNFPEHTQFDICLFWDFLNYLEQPALRALNSTMQAVIHKDTSAHCFTVFSAKNQLPNHQYGIQDIEKLTIRQRQDQPMNCHAYSQAELSKFLPCFHISKATLLADGRLEMLLNASAQQK